MTIPKTVFAEYQITKNTQAISASVLFIKKTGKLKGFMQKKYLCFFPWGKGLLLLHTLFLESHVFISGAVLVHIVSHRASLAAEHASPYAKQWQLPMSFNQSREKEDVHPLKKAVNLQSPHQWGM